MENKSINLINNESHFFSFLTSGVIDCFKFAS